MKEVLPIGEQLREIGDSLRWEGRAIRAIGILGSGVADKLLLLRTLRPQFPEALFFTANFDQAFTRESELPFTQNLLVASSYGPALQTKIQAHTHGFIASDPASAFLASLLAIGDPARDWAASEEMRENLSDQLLVSRVFVIGHDGKVAALSGEGTPVRLAGDVAEGRSLAQPALPENHLSWFARNSSPLLGLGLAGTVLIFLLGFSPLLRQILHVSLARGRRRGALRLLPPES